MSKQIIFGGSLGTLLLNTGNVRYLAIMGGSGTGWTSDSGASGMFQIVPTAGSFSNLRVSLRVAPGSGKSYTFVLRKNGVDTDLAVVISDSSTTEIDIADSISFSAGDIISLKCTPSGTPASTCASWSCVFTPVTPGQTILMGKSTNTYTGVYLGGFSGEFASKANYIWCATLLPCAGTLSNFWIACSAAPSTDITSTIYINDITATDFLVSINTSNTIGYDTEHTCAVNAGDIISHTTNGTDFWDAYKPAFSCVFTPSVSGQFVIPHLGNGNIGDIQDGTWYYYLISHGNSGYHADENYAKIKSAFAFTIKNIYVHCDGGPGTGKNFYFTLRKNAEDTALTVTLANTYLGNASADISIEEGDFLDTEVIGDASSSNKSPAISYLGYIEEATANYSRGNYASLPSGVTDLENIYTEQEVTDIVDDNSVRITQDATSEYAIHQYKNDVGTYPSGIFRWNGQSSLAPSSSPVVLQVYKVNGTTWETKDTKSTGDADTDFDLSFSLADLTDYKDGDGIVTCRVYQQNV